MSSGILGQLYQGTNNELIIRQNALEVWYDLFIYAKNLKGNWMVSQEIFNLRIAPTALNKPEYFADCVEEMVKVSGMKVKRSSSFKKSIKLLKSLKNKSIEPELIMATITNIFKAGLEEPLYAERAIRFCGEPVIA